MTRRAVWVMLAMVLAACGGASEADAPTFARDVAPIVYASCAPCHRPGEPAPFPLLGYDDVFRKREQIVEVTQQRVMPPWLMTHGDFVDDRRLSPAAVDTLRRWVEAGAPRGDAAAEPPPPQFPQGWQLREPDLVVEATEAVSVPASGPNLFRNVVIPVDPGRLRYVEAVEIRPGSRAVHHAVLAVDGTRESRRLDALDAEPGFPGMVLGGAGPPDGHFLGWTPGKRVAVHAAGMAWRLWPGQDLVLQLHLVPTGKPETVRPRIGLHFTDVPTTVEPFPLALFSEQIDLPPGTVDFVLRDHVVVPVPITVHAIYPHAHYLCRRMRGTATLPDGSERELFRIDAWDFDWQDDYRYRRPLELPAGTRLSIEYVYDNSEANPANPSRPPVHVRFGQDSADEMGTLTLSVTVANLEQRRLLARASLRRDLEKVPGATNLWLQLCGVERERGDLDAAFAAARRAQQLGADTAALWFELGMCSERAGRLDDAAASYRQALQRDAGHGMAGAQLGGILARAGQAAAAIELFERALATHPNLALLHHNLATACFTEGQLERAERHYRRALDLEPRYFLAQFLLGKLLAQQGRKPEAREALQRALGLRPGDAAVAAALAELGR